MTTKQIQELALGVGILGALVIAWGSAIMVWAQRSYQGPTDSHHRREKVAHLIGAILVAAAFGALLYASLKPKP